MPPTPASPIPHVRHLLTVVAIACDTIRPKAVKRPHSFSVAISLTSPLPQRNAWDTVPNASPTYLLHRVSYTDL